MKYLISFCLFFLFINCSFAQEIKPEVKVGISAILSSDLAFYGRSDINATKTYLKNYSRHNIKLFVEDGGLSSLEGLKSYQKLINIDKIDMLIAAGTSNGIMAAKSLINNSRTLTMMASTGGQNIDKAGPWIFRIGNSDTLNGIEQAKYFLDKKLKKIALLTEQTEYTIDISKAFKKTFLAGGGELVYDQNFLPDTRDFKTIATKILSKKPDALFMPTQTGLALGILLKQLRLQESNGKLEVHTTMVAAPNQDAHQIAGNHIIGVYFMDPNYAADSQKYKDFLKLYQQEHKESPATPFHIASVIDSLEHLQNFLDKYKQYNSEKFQKYLISEVGEYCGYMGCYSFDSEGNTNLGFHNAVIKERITQ